MDSPETITVYEAIRLMREMTSKGQMFSFVHATYNRDTSKSDGVVHVKRAKLRPAAKGDNIKNAKYKLFYYDDYYKQDRVCWQPLLMFLNNTKVVLK